MLSKDPQKEAEYGRQLLICIQVCVSRPANCMNTSTSRSKKKLFTDAKINSLAFNLKDYGSENFWVTYSCTSPNKLDCQVSQMGSDNKQPLQQTTFAAALTADRNTGQRAIKLPLNFEQHANCCTGQRVCIALTAKLDNRSDAPLTAVCKILRSSHL